MALADLSGRHGIARKVDVQAALGQQALALDRGRVFLARTVIEDGRRRDHGQLDVDGNGMALIGPDLRFLVIEGIALLVVCAHDFFQDSFIDRILPADAGQQFFHIGPAVPVQSHAGHPGLMAQDEAEVAADTR